MSLSVLSASSGAVALVVAAGLLGGPLQDRGPSRPDPLKQDADRMVASIARIQALAESQADDAREPVRTVLTEPEINAYLFWNGGEVLPAGLTDPRIHLIGDGQVSADAVVDLTAIRNQRTRGWLDPLAYVGGQMALAASGVIRAKDGFARVELSKVTLGGVEVPKSVLQELVAYYTRSAEAPGGVNIDEPIPLPGGVRDLLVGKGQAVVIQ